MFVLIASSKLGFAVNAFVLDIKVLDVCNNGLHVNMHQSKMILFAFLTLAFSFSMCIYIFLGVNFPCIEYIYFMGLVK